MTEHDHMPPISRYTARWLCPGKICVLATGDTLLIISSEEALRLAQSITEALQQEPTE